MSKPAKQSSPPDELTFEKALAELEKTVAKMEDGSLSLEHSLAAHKRGLELAKFCQEKLATAEAQVKVLEGDVLKKLAAAVESGASED
jgi:exodeoxyribonuclease VII small subunit